MLGVDAGSGSLSIDEVKPTREPTPTAQPLSTRLSGEDLPLLEFGPPGESQNDRGRPRLSGDTVTLDTDHFRIHYTYDGADGVPDRDANSNEHPDFVEEVARAFEFSWSAEIDHFGWAAPPSDEGLGGDDRYDVYLQNILDEDYAGYTDSDRGESNIGDNPNSPLIEEEDSTHSHIVLDNDYAEYEDFQEPGISLLEYMRSTAAHEFNHAIQFGYDGVEPHDWLWEATATWMEDEVFDSINETIRTLSAVFKSPDSCQLTEGGEDRVEDSDHWYGMWILLRYLSEHYGHQAVLRLWELAANQDGYDVWDSLMEENELTLEDFFRDYSVALLTRDFQEGLRYPTVRLEGRVSIGEEFEPLDGVQQLGADYIEILGDETFSVFIDNEELSGVIVGVTDEESYIYPLAQNFATINPAGHEHTYLIVMDLKRAIGPANCRIDEYTVDVEPAHLPQDPAWTASALNFQLPRVEDLLDPADFFEE